MSAAAGFRCIDNAKPKEDEMFDMPYRKHDFIAEVDCITDDIGEFVQSMDTMLTARKGTITIVLGEGGGGSHVVAIGVDDPEAAKGVMHQLDMNGYDDTSISIKKIKVWDKKEKIYRDLLTIVNPEVVVRWMQTIRDDEYWANADSHKAMLDIIDWHNSNTEAKDEAHG